MSTSELEAKIAAVSKRFDEVTKEKAEVDNKSQELNTELIRLQGEYRAYNNMLQEQQDPAKTIKVDPKAFETKSKAEVK